VLEKRVAAMEGGIAALAMASGMAAITYAIQTIAEAGDNIVSSSTLYGGTYNLFAHTLPQYGIEVRFADYRDPAARAADRRRPRPSSANPSATRWATSPTSAGRNRPRPWRAAHRRQHRASPYLCRPFEHGADIVVHR
jgi:O-acetylhomoserine (thiol)-lyase